SRSSRPSARATAPASASAWSTASCGSRAAMWASTASPAKARASASICRATPRPRSRLRRVVVRQLNDLGYRVLEAADAEEALALVPRHRIDLLFTDVVMPGEVSGAELARKAVALAPRLKVLFTSGYPQARTSEGWLPPAAKLLTKPYRKDARAPRRAGSALARCASPRRWSAAR